MSKRAALWPTRPATCATWRGILAAGPARAVVRCLVSRKLFDDL
ncbi:MAG: hypothetical protein U1F67_04280 [Rubrivivax sp.]